MDGNESGFSGLLRSVQSIGPISGMDDVPRNAAGRSPIVQVVRLLSSILIGEMPASLFRNWEMWLNNMMASLLMGYVGVMPDCPRCRGLEALKENYRLAEAIARGEESCARQLESNLNMAGGEIQCCYRRIRQLEAALEKYGEHQDDCHLRARHDSASFCLSAGEHGCTCGFTVFRGTPNG